MNFLRNFMIGRYGPDHLNTALIILGLIVGFLSRIPHVGFLVYLSYFILLICLFRLFSRNIAKRRRENDRFLRYWWPIKQKCKGFYSNLKSRKTHKFFRCPSCKNLLRVPRGKGKLQITCPKCGQRFIKKT